MRHVIAAHVCVYKEQKYSRCFSTITVIVRWVLKEKCTVYLSIVCFVFSLRH